VRLAPSVSATLPDKLFSELGSNTNWNERKTSGKLSVIVLWSWLKYCHWLAICYVCTGGGSDKRLGASSLLCFMQLGRGRYVKTQLSLYPIYYDDDDMFRPLWATFRSHKSIMRKIIHCMIISSGAYSERPRISRHLVYPYWTNTNSYKQSTESLKGM